ncbi:M14 family metallopeptidase [Lentiprolixibacter aurantiacus]|uniref:M14 family metallopeptidase n=1 Tax=Lentiprolixibacter aurantiacus TaxID=2993939 RepID=A0AAE3MLR5_9FLAO|nr:M14 metallopeptidase family protein [Lentiprolixibacter aurantiacus]MCX2719513.1 M14 family metallopeptidase [Lentiprolixibacter aurantiacus]
MDVFQISHKDYKVSSITGRYILPGQVNKFFEACPESVQVHSLGKSAEGRNIQMAELGAGEIKILMWSQMHGNESTTTKAVVDLIAFLSSRNPTAMQLLEKCQLRIIGMLNPDGAVRYTRENANGIDLNRDAHERTQPESRILRKAFESFAPDFCFNLHDQRTIYNVGHTDSPATLSFLAPSRDEERTVDASREMSMQVIAAINEKLQRKIPGHIGRYDDAFNINCIGDTLQMHGTPTLLFEAGHYPGDYEREIVRGYVFHSLLAAIDTIANASYLRYDVESYLGIPENNKLYFDVLIRNFQWNNNKSAVEDLGILFREELQEGRIGFKPYIQKRGDLGTYFGHTTYDFSNQKDLDSLINSSLRTILDI